MRFLKLFIILLIISPASYCQNWQPLGAGLDYHCRAMFTDTVDNALYIAGPFFTIDNKNCRGIARWDGTKWDSLGAGIDPLGFIGNRPSNTLTIARYDNHLYIGGVFSSVGDYHSKYIARWDGNNWDSIPCPNHSVYKLRVVDNELYVGGAFDTIQGIPVNKLAKWDGSQWSGVFFPAYEYFSYISEIEYYNGELYVAGSFGNLVDPEKNIVRWDGMEWKPVGNGIRGNIVYINSMEVFQGELFVAGSFQKSAGNTGNSIQKWNGSEWQEVGGGITNGYISHLIPHKNKLYAVGNFETAGGIPVSNVAIWDGENWCGTGSYIDNGISRGAIYNDSLFIGGGFWTIDGDSMNYIAKWGIASNVDTCGNTTNIEKLQVEKDKISVYPNPSNGNYSIEFDSKSANSAVEVYNVLGKKVFASPVNEVGNVKAKIDISSFPEGVYIVNVFDGRRFYSRKIINRK